MNDAELLYTILVLAGLFIFSILLDSKSEKNICATCKVKFNIDEPKLPHPDYFGKKICINCLDRIREEKSKRKPEEDSKKILKKISKLKLKEKKESISKKENIRNLHKLNKLSIIDKAEITKNITSKFDHKKFKDIRDYLSDEKEIIEAFKILHESLRELYEKEIENKGMLKSHVPIDIWKKELDACMAMGEKYLIETKGFFNNKDDQISIADESKPINKEYSWKELKDREGFS